MLELLGSLSGWARAWLGLLFCMLHMTVCAQIGSLHNAAVAPSQGSYSATFEMATGLPSTVTVQEVAALPNERFAPFDPRATQPIARDKPLWLRLKFDSDHLAVSKWVLEMPSVVVDRYEVYQRNAQGIWQQAAAGDYVAHANWPLKSIRPRFPLKTASSVTHEVYIRVVHLMPSRISPAIADANAATSADLSLILLMGGLVGLFSVLIMLCIQMAVTYRDSTYFWYAGYLFFTMFTALAYSGIGQYFLWSNATKFSSDAVVHFQLTAFAFNLQFVNAMFGSRLGVVHGWMTRILIAICAAFVVHMLLGGEHAETVTIFMAIVMASCVFIVGTALSAWRKKIPYSGYWLFIYGPFLASIALASSENAGQISLPWLPPNLPLITIMIEAMAMMFCLNAFSREGHAQAVREQTAAQRDPLTGFLNESNFMHSAAAAWLRASRAGGEITIAYVLVESSEPELSTVQLEAQILQIARKVRVTMRESDEFGRVGRNILSIAMPNVQPGDALNARLSRLVAVGSKFDPNSNGELAVQLTLAAASRRITPDSFQTIDKKLRTLLIKDSEETPRTIRFLES